MKKEDGVKLSKRTADGKIAYLIKPILKVLQDAGGQLERSEIKERIVVVWLGGHALHWPHTREFNMRQDVAAARVVMGSEVPFVQLPCLGVVSSFRISGPELEFWLKGKNAIAEYLAQNTITAAERYAAKMAWTRCLWDVTAVAWLKNRGDRFLLSRLVPAPLPTYERQYEQRGDAAFMRYVYYVNRDELMNDLFSVVKA